MERTKQDQNGTAGRSAFTVLYIDPDGTHRSRVEETLTPTYSVRTATTLDQADGMTTRDIDCILTRTTPGVLERIDGEWSDWPVVIIADEIDPDTLASAVRSRVADIVFTGKEFEAPLKEAIDRQYQEAVTDISDTILSIAGSLMGAAPDEMDTKIEWGLRSVAQRLNADACVFYEVTENLEPTHNWVRDGDLDLLESFSPIEFPGYEYLEQFDTHYVPKQETDASEDGISPDAIPDGFVGEVDALVGAEQGANDHPEFLTERGIEAFLAVPVVIEWELRNVLVLARRTDRGWPDAVRKQTKTLGEIIGHTLRRERRREELKRQNERLERFASVVSHDLQNPLNIINGYTELAIETGDMFHLEEVIAAAERMDAMLDDLLALAQEGQNLGELTDTDLAELAQEAWTGVDTKEATLEIDDPGTVQADQNRLRQVFENIYRNAVEHAGKDVTMRVVGTADGFAIEDDGPGIPPEKRDEVFEEGHTGGGGTGLGLSIVKTVVEAHGWEVKLTDGTEGGARFEITVT